MECREVKEALSAYIDGETGVEEKTHVEEHLGSCEDCIGALEELRRSVGHLRNLKEVEPPPWLTKKVMARVKSESLKKEGIYQRLFPQFLVPRPIHALAAILVLVISVYVFQSMKTEVKYVGAPQKETGKPDLSKEKPDFAVKDEIVREDAMPGEKPTPEMGEVESKKSLEMKGETPTPVERKEKPPPPPGKYFGAGKTSSEFRDDYAVDERERARQKVPTTEADKSAPAKEGRTAPPKAPSRAKAASEKTMEFDKLGEKPPVSPEIQEEKGAVLSADARAKREAKRSVELPGISPPDEEKRLRINLSVDKIETARQDIEKAVAELGGSVIEKEFIADTQALYHATLKTADVPKLREKLKLIGEVEEEEEFPYSGRDGELEINIEIAATQINP